MYILINTVAKKIGGGETGLWGGFPRFPPPPPLHETLYIHVQWRLLNGIHVHIKYIHMGNSNVTLTKCYQFLAWLNLVSILAS